MSFTRPQCKLGRQCRQLNEVKKAHLVDFVLLLYQITFLLDELNSLTTNLIRDTNGLEIFSHQETAQQFLIKSVHGLFFVLYAPVGSSCDRSAHYSWLQQFALYFVVGLCPREGIVGEFTLKGSRRTCLSRLLIDIRLLFVDG